MTQLINQTNFPVVIKTESYAYKVVEQDSKILFWLQNSLTRVYPKSDPDGGERITLITPRNGRLSFQACLRNQSMQKVKAACEVEGSDGFQISVRCVGWVPQHYLTHSTELTELEGAQYTPGMVPDPLLPESDAVVQPYTNQSFWITIQVPVDMEPGEYQLKVIFKLSACQYDFVLESGSKSSAYENDTVLTADINVSKVVLKPRENFPVTHWWYPDCICDWNRIEHFGEQFFRIVRDYLQNMLDHGNNVLYVPILNARAEIMERPPQMLIVQETSPGKYEFGWERLRRLVRMGKELGFEWFEWTHFWAYSHEKDRAASASTPTRIYTERNGRMELLFPENLEATGEVFSTYLSQFLPALKQFLVEENILDISLFHVSDEPGDSEEDFENYRRARKLMESIDPSIKVLDAIYNEEYATEGLVDYPVPIVHGANNFLKSGIPHWAYYCLHPLGPFMNRLFDTPLAKIRMQGAVFYRLRTLGFLHWGLNYWYLFNGGYDKDCQTLLDPFADGAGGQKIPYGDTFVIYPGKDGPIDSIRWEIFAESMQDYSLLQTLGIDPNDERLQEIVDYADFPKTVQWHQNLMMNLLGD